MKRTGAALLALIGCLLLTAFSCGARSGDVSGQPAITLGGAPAIPADDEPGLPADGGSAESCQGDAVQVDYPFDITDGGRPAATAYLYSSEACQAVWAEVMPAEPLDHLTIDVVRSLGCDLASPNIAYVDTVGSQPGVILVSPTLGYDEFEYAFHVEAFLKIGGPMALSPCHEVG